MRVFQLHYNETAAAADFFVGEESVRVCMAEFERHRW
jgi:hypothetical protein